MTIAASPQPPETVALRLGSDAATERLGRWFADRVGPGDVLLLDGPIGAGKTHFARALIQARLAAAGRIEEVPSPTFTLVQTYDDGAVQIWHADLYRLASSGEVTELGLEEAFETAICLVEWPDRLGADRPGAALGLRFSPIEAGAARRVEIAGGPRWAGRLAALRAEWGDDG